MEVVRCPDSLVSHKLLSDFFVSFVHFLFSLFKHLVLKSGVQLCSLLGNELISPVAFIIKSQTLLGFLSFCLFLQFAQGLLLLSLCLEFFIVTVFVARSVHVSLLYELEDLLRNF